MNTRKARTAAAARCGDHRDPYPMAPLRRVQLVVTKVSIVIPVYNEEATIQNWSAWWWPPRCPPG